MDKDIVDILMFIPVYRGCSWLVTNNKECLENLSQDALFEKAFTLAHYQFFPHIRLFPKVYTE
jgi:hypothetical protein